MQGDAEPPDLLERARLGLRPGGEEPVLGLVELALRRLDPQGGRAREGAGDEREDPEAARRPRPVLERPPRRLEAGQGMPRRAVTRSRGCAAKA